MLWSRLCLMLTCSWRLCLRVDHYSRAHKEPNPDSTATMLNDTSPVAFPYSLKNLVSLCKETMKTLKTSRERAKIVNRANMINLR